MVQGQGALPNGLPSDGAISVAGKTDAWTVAANQGDRMTVQIAELSGGAGFAPRIEMLAPDGTVMGAGTGGVAARLDFQAQVTGTFTVVVSDNGRTGTGTYRLQLAQVPGVFTVPVGDEGGALTNGANHSGAIALGDLDIWTFTASPGDRIALQIGETAGAAGFTPQIELFAPGGARLGGSSGGVAARMDAQAAVGGIYMVLVSDLNHTGTGSYLLRLAQVPDSFVVPTGDDGGALTNGANQSGAIEVGDLDLWSFSANEGDRITLQLGELTGASAFTPMIELFAPSGARLAVRSDGSVVRVEAAAEVSGTYTVLVSDANQTGTGTYQLLLARVPAAFTVPVGDEGGALVNSVDQDGSIAQGDLDFWSFAAAPGDRLTLLITELTGGASFAPMIELFAPDGHRKRVAQGASSATLDVVVELGGIYSVLVSDASRIGAGTYRLRLTQIAMALPGPNVLINGTTYLGTISLAGQSNLWTFTASAGESIVVSAGETAATGLIPWLRLSGPTGALLASDFNAAAAEVTFRATNSGTFTVAIADGSGAGNQTGDYRISLAKTGRPLTISPLDEGGSLTNGASVLATIDTGDVDAWTFLATAGESIEVWMGEVSAGSTLLPWLRIYGPDGALLSQDFSGAAAEVRVMATNSGTFLVVVSDGTSGRNGVGDYRLSLAKTGSALEISPSDEGGELINGTTYTAAIETGDVDAWTFTANAGESVAVWMGETISGSSLLPWLRLYGPDGVLLRQDFNAAAAEVTFRATNSGTFTVVVSDGTSGRSGNGNYRLSLAKTGNALAISPSDEGGGLINGTSYTATIDTGDVDAWTFIANAGETLVVRAGETTAASLLPWVRLFGPDGAPLSSDFNAAAAETAFRATNSGTFTVIVSDGTSGRNGSGDYRLSLARTGVPLAISPTDEGGSLVNGTTYLATIDTGDIDAWTFTATAGENIIVRMGETTAAASLLPWLRLYGPDGVLLDADFNATAAEVTVRATNSGTFMVVTADGNSALSGSGNYRLSLAKTGGPLTITPPDEGGELVNGATYLATIETGDVDAWTFTARAGETIIVRVGETTAAATLLPWLRLFGPDGAPLNADFNATAAEVTFRATNNGIFQVVVADGNSALSGSGDYRLTLAKTGDAVAVSAGEEGGGLNGADTYDGTIDTGDLDVFSFTACLGDSIQFRMDELVAGSSLSPWLRLYGRDGVLIRSSSGAATASINMTATNTGTFTVVTGDGNGNFSGNGTYRLTVNGLSAGTKLCVPRVVGTNVTLSGVGGAAGTDFIVLTSPLVEAPLPTWTPIFTNQFDFFGTFTSTNPAARTEPRRFFIIRQSGAVESN